MSSISQYSSDVHWSVCCVLGRIHTRSCAWSWDNTIWALWMRKSRYSISKMSSSISIGSKYQLWPLLIKIHQHPLCWKHNCSSPREGRYSNDIALVKLRRKGDRSGIRFSSNVAPACLPEKDLEFESGTDCVIAGWGKTQGKNRKLRFQ